MGADARAHADRNVDHVEVQRAGQELAGVGGDAEHEVGVIRRHHVQIALVGEPLRVLASRLEVMTLLDQNRAERAHRSVLVRAVAVRHDDRDVDAERPTGERQALAVVAPRRADQRPGRQAASSRLTRVPIDVHQAATHLERAGRRVVLVLDPHLGTELVGQHRPGVLRGRRHVPVDERGGIVEFGQGERWSRHAPLTLAHLGHPVPADSGCQVKPPWQSVTPSSIDGNRHRGFWASIVCTAPRTTPSRRPTASAS